MQRKKWCDIESNERNLGKWFALMDCAFNGEELHTCTVVDEDASLTALEERLAARGITSCIIKFCGEEPECSENPRITRTTTIVDKPDK